MTHDADDRPQRLVFGSVARDYDAHRPGYPGALFDHLLDGLGPGALAVDAGCGTGRVAAGLAARGVMGTAIEPDADMAAVASERLRESDWVVQVSDFESCDVAAGTVDLITCGQAWHWIDPDRGLGRARELLRPGGRLALFWNRPEFHRMPRLRAALDAIYERLEPDLASSIGGDGQPPKGRPPDTEAAPRGFTDVRMDEFRHDRIYTAEEWTALLATHSNHVMLGAERRNRLHGEIAEAIRTHGGSLEVVYRCECWSARRSA